jgi:hypothetical protein
MKFKTSNPMDTVAIAAGVSAGLNGQTLLQAKVNALAQKPALAAGIITAIGIGGKMFAPKSFASFFDGVAAAGVASLAQPLVSGIVQQAVSDALRGRSMGRVGSTSGVQNAYGKQWSVLENAA